jgi:hypothetical protein
MMYGEYEPKCIEDLEENTYRRNRKSGLNRKQREAKMNLEDAEQRIKNWELKHGIVR